MPGAQAQPRAHREPGLRRPAPRESQRQRNGPGRPCSKPEHGSGRRGEEQECRRQQTEETLASSPLHLKQPGKITLMKIPLGAPSHILLLDVTGHVLNVWITSTVTYCSLKTHSSLWLMHAILCDLCEMLLACVSHCHSLLLYIDLSSLFLSSSLHAFTFAPPHN